METIKSLTGKWSPLSNFHTEANGKTAEHIFQAAKTEDPAERTHILSRPKPGQAKYAGKRCTLRSDWESIKIDIMEKSSAANSATKASAESSTRRGTRKSSREINGTIISGEPAHAPDAQHDPPGISSEGFS